MKNDVLKWCIKSEGDPMARWKYIFLSKFFYFSYFVWIKKEIWRCGFEKKMYIKLSCLD